MYSKEEGTRQVMRPVGNEAMLVSRHRSVEQNVALIHMPRQQPPGKGQLKPEVMLIFSICHQLGCFI